MIAIAIIEVAGGLGLLLVGGEALLRGAVAMARRLGLSKLLIGLTVVAAATSMPEMVVVVATGLEGVPDIGVGNVIGSNIANVLLILGTAALFFPIATRPRDVLRDGVAALVAAGIFIAFALLGTFTWMHGAVMVALLAGYIVFTYRDERVRPLLDDVQNEGDDEDAGIPNSCTLGGLLVVGGVAGLVLGSELLIDGAVEIAHAAGVSDAVIGLTLVAVGTSLPELATAIVAGIRRHSEVALGNVLGSNLFNLLAVIPALAFATPFRVAPELIRVDCWVMIGVSALLLPVMITGWRVGRREGALFLVLYGGYIGWLLYRMPPGSV